MQSNAIILAIIALNLCLENYTLSGTRKHRIKHAHRAGTWYPDKRPELLHTLGQLTTTAVEKYGLVADGSQIRALIVPHAGYIFSGAVAAAAFSLIKQQKIDCVIVLGPSHFADFQGVALPNFTSYQIPLGTLKIDSRVSRLLAKNTLFHKQENAFQPEHSIEVELPFISFFLPQAKIVPLVIGHLTPQEVKTVAQQLKTIITPSTLVVISSDLTHYGESFNYTPFKDQDHVIERVMQLDSEILSLIQHKEAEAFAKNMRTTGATICGRTGIEILLELIELKTFDPCIVRCIAYSSSHEVSPPLTTTSASFVTYASLVVTQEIGNTDVGTFDKQALLRYARALLEQSFSKTIDESLLAPVTTLPLEKLHGVFVTLYTIKNGKKELRGCIGNTTSTKRLYENVADMTRAAAFNDPRFPPLEASELPHIKLEISILSPARAVDSYRDIQLNKQGIILSAQNKSALFLPKVPEEFGFNLEQTLTALSRKAGLPEDAWKSPTTQFQVFNAIDFGEAYPSETQS